MRYYSAIDIKPTSYSIEMLSPDLRETFVLSEVLSNLARLRLGQSESASGEHFNQNRRLKINKADLLPFFNSSFIKVTPSSYRIYQKKNCYHFIMLTVLLSVPYHIYVAQAIFQFPSQASLLAKSFIRKQTQQFYWTKCTTIIWTNHSHPPLS